MFAITSSGFGTKPDNTLRLLAACGVIGPILFTSIVIILGLLRPGYNHVSQTMSELGEVGAPNAVIQDANFILYGLLTIAFAYGLHKDVSYGKGSKVGPILVGFFGGVLMEAGINPLPSPSHVPASIPAFVALTIAPLIISRRLKQDIRWQGYRSYSLVTGVIAIILLLLVLSTGQGVLKPWFGALQRIAVAPLFLWIEVIAIHLLRISNRSKA